MPRATLIGKQAPSISLPNYTGEMYSLTPGESNIPTVLFFYPASGISFSFQNIVTVSDLRTGSYGCTKEACQFRDAIAGKDTFKPGKVQIIGLSPDPVDKQKQFVEKEKLTYPVLSDANGEAVKAYGIGKGLLGLASVARVTVVIDRKGIVRDTLNATINYGAHSKFVAKWLDKLQAEEAASVSQSETSPEVSG